MSTCTARQDWATPEDRLIQLLSWPIKPDSPEHREIWSLCQQLRIRLRLNLPLNAWEKTANDGESWERLDPYTLAWGATT